MTEKIPTQRILSQAVAGQQNWAVEHLKKFIACPSVLGAEQSAQEYIAGVYDELGFATRFLPVDVDRIKNLAGYSPTDWSYAGRSNVVGVHDVKNPAGRSLIFNGHVDVVSPEPVKLWRHDPFTASIAHEEGDTYIYGRGAGDMKGGSICYLWTLKTLQEIGLECLPDTRTLQRNHIVHANRRNLVSGARGGKNHPCAGR